jgi:SulP family sulfate permease
MNTIKLEKKFLNSDFLAGLTFALENIPQSIAHALLASINPVFGLYTLMLATPLGTLFTSAGFMNTSMTSALAVTAGDTLTAYPSVDRSPVLVTLVLLIGVFQVVLGLFCLSWVTRFIPVSVMTGFMNGVAIYGLAGEDLYREDNKRGEMTI